MKRLVVVVVQTCSMTHVSVDMRQRMHLIRVAGHLGVTLPASPPRLPRPNGGVNPGPVPAHKALPSVQASTCCNCRISTAFSQTAPEETAGPAHRDVEHLVNELQLGNH